MAVSKERLRELLDGDERGQDESRKGEAEPGPIGRGQRQAHVEHKREDSEEDGVPHFVAGEESIESGDEARQLAFVSRDHNGGDEDRTGQC